MCGIAGFNYYDKKILKDMGIKHQKAESNYSLFSGLKLCLICGTKNGWDE